MVLWNPVAEMNRMQNELNSFFRAFDEPLTGRRMPFWSTPGVRHYPLINMYEDKDNYQIEALAPGFDPNKFDISLTGNTLTLSGDNTPKEETQPENYLRSERFIGKFTRTFELPGEVNADNVNAEYKHGVLTITVPKAEHTKPRSIEVKVSS